MDMNLSERLSYDSLENNCSSDENVVLIFVIVFPIFFENHSVYLLFIKFYHLLKKVRKKGKYLLLLLLHFILFLVYQIDL